MNQLLPSVCLVRHGETAWSLSGQHTGLSDIPLTEHGERDARGLGPRLTGKTFAQVFTSPLQRAQRTCSLAGFGSVAQIDADLVEWDYGAYEGKKSEDIRRDRPDWQIFRDGCPQGESVADIGARADRMIARLRALDGDTLLFSHSHFLRVFAARWCGLDASVGRHFLLGTASVSLVGYDHNRAEPLIRRWNEVPPER